MADRAEKTKRCFLRWRTSRTSWSTRTVVGTVHSLARPAVPQPDDARSSLARPAPQVVFGLVARRGQERFDGVSGCAALAGQSEQHGGLGGARGTSVQCADKVVVARRGPSRPVAARMAVSASSAGTASAAVGNPARASATNSITSAAGGPGAHGLLDGGARTRSPAASKHGTGQHMSENAR
jgi:hypothetical protein